MTTLTTIPFVGLDRQHETLIDELRSAFERVVQANDFILGASLEAFEREFADYCGVKHCVGVGSGTAALTLAMLAGGIGAGDEVIVPAHTYIASALAVLHAGATPVFCDVDARTALIDARAAEAAITDRTAAILPVHLYGQVCDMAALGELARRRGLALFEDAAQAHGARYRGRRAGSFGLASAFSFYPSKNLGALGDGGAVCTDDDEVAARARMLRNLGQRRKGEHLLAGFNERLDGMQAAMLSVKLSHLDAWNDARRARAADYRDGLPEVLGLLEEKPDSPCIYHVFPVRTPNREELARRLAESGIQTGVHYFPAVPAQPPFQATRGRFPAADAWAAEELSLPMFETLEPHEALRVVDACRAAVDDL